MAKHSLYQCLNAKVLGEKIYCNKGYNWKKFGVTIRQLERGDPLKFTVCQQCPDYDRMGPSVPDGERGWLNL